jgi:hypothetical protein
MCRPCVTHMHLPCEASVNHLQRQRSRRRSSGSRRLVLRVVTEAGSRIARQRGQQQVRSQQRGPQLRCQARLTSCGSSILQVTIQPTVTEAPAIPVNPKQSACRRLVMHYQTWGHHPAAVISCNRCSYPAHMIERPARDGTCKRRSADRCSSVAAAARQLPSQTSVRSTRGCRSCVHDNHKWLWRRKRGADGVRQPPAVQLVPLSHADRMIGGHWRFSKSVQIQHAITAGEHCLDEGKEDHLQQLAMWRSKHSPTQRTSSTWACLPSLTRRGPSSSTSYSRSA